jgi:hypothetical protein
MQITVDDIAKLPKRQRDVLAQVCVNNDAGHHPATLEALERKGFLRSYGETLGGRFPVRIKRYAVASIAVHMAWCQWCSRSEKRPERPRRKPADKGPTLF